MRVTLAPTARLSRASLVPRLLLCFGRSRVDGVPAGVLLSDAGAYRRGGGTALGLLAVTKLWGLATKAEQAPTVTASTDKQRMM